MLEETRICQSCSGNFLIKTEDFVFYEKMGVPAPTFCLDCRLQRRFASRNERFLYKRDCGLCGKKTLAIYSPDEPYIVYCVSCWWSDNWNPGDYAREYDFSKDFFTQYSEFKKSVPHEALYQSNFVNSEYANFGFNYKDCYLVSGGWDNERLYYATQVNNVTDSFDILLGNKLELCYDAIQCARSSSLRHCISCEDSSDLFLSIDCRGCVSCFGCVGLRNKMYHIFNQPYSKEEYEKKIAEFGIDKHANVLKLMEQFKEVYLSHPFRFSRFRNAIDCTGDNIIDSKNAKNSFSMTDVENIKYGLFLNKQKDSYDVSYIGKGGEEAYEVISSFGGSKQIGGVRVLFCQESFYSEDCHNCNNIFGCIGLKKKSYCIFNKQYSKEEYTKILEQIIEQMKTISYVDIKGRKYYFGDFWPIELEPYAYNETKAQELFPLTKEEAILKGYRWRDKEKSTYQITKESTELPESINEIGDDVIQEVVGCEHNGLCQHNCTSAYRILKNELEFYRRMNIPLPRLCPNCRHGERIAKASPFKLYDRVCMCDKTNHPHKGKCHIEFETSYAPDRPEIIYCEKCYQQEVY